MHGVLDDVGFNQHSQAAKPEPDHCDTCKGTGALVEAFIFAEVNGTVLAWCAHHGRPKLGALLEAGYPVRDDTDRLKAAIR